MPRPLADFGMPRPPEDCGVPRPPGRCQRAPPPGGLRRAPPRLLPTLLTRLLHLDGSRPPPDSACLTHQPSKALAPRGPESLAFQVSPHRIAEKGGGSGKEEKEENPQGLGSRLPTRPPLHLRESGTLFPRMRPLVVNQ